MFDIELQKKIIKFLVNYRRMDLLNLLDETLFDDDLLSEIFLYIRKYSKEKMMIPGFDMIRFECGGIFENESEFTSRKKDIVSLVDEISSLEINPEEIENLIIRFIQVQKLKFLLLDVSDDVVRGELNINSYMARLLELKRIEETRDEKFLDYFENPEIVTKSEMKIPTPFPTLNKYLRGGVSYGELCMVLGETNIGKTMFLLNLVKPALIIGKNVLYITLEIQPEDLKVRLGSILSGFTFEEMMKKKNKFLKRIQNYNKSKLYILGYPSGAKSVYTLERDIQEFEMDGSKIDMMIVDYPDLFSPEAKDDWISLSRIYSVLRGFAVKYDMVIWTASQIRREDFGSDYSNKSVGRSIEKINIADHAFGLISKNSELKRLKILKLRRPGNFRGKYIKLSVDYSVGVIVENSSGDVRTVSLDL